MEKKINSFLFVNIPKIQFNWINDLLIVLKRFINTFGSSDASSDIENRITEIDELST